MKYVAWATRYLSETEPSDGQDKVIRESAAEQGIRDIPAATPGWAKDHGFAVSYSSEQFPGARPVWIWEK